MFNNFDFDLLGFATPSKNIFNTFGLKDLYPSRIEKIDDGYRVTLKTLGIEKVEVSDTDKGLLVEGKNEINGHEYSALIEIPVAKAVMDNIEEVHVTTIAGITILDIVVKTPQKRSFKILHD